MDIADGRINITATLPEGPLTIAGSYAAFERFVRTLACPYAWPPEDDLAPPDDEPRSRLRRVR